MKKIIIFAISAVLLLSTVLSASAGTWYQMEYLPGTTDTVTNLPSEVEIEPNETYTVSSQIPEREGYEFVDWILDFDVKKKVTYVVNPDSTYGTPEGSTVPEDSNLYKPGETVDVKDQLTTTVDYAYNEKGEKVKGTWEFTVWDKDDFDIYEDTTITGGWSFEPAPVKKYKYIVHYKLYEGSIENAKTVNKDTEGTVDALYTTVHIDAIQVNELSVKRYRKNTKILSGFQHLDVTITHDNYEITIWYELKNTTG